MDAALGTVTLVPLTGLIPLGFAVLAVFMQPGQVLVRSVSDGAGRATRSG
ncbi:MAG: hypothetical protein ACXWWX_01410 [Actinomycetota bacterium]